MSVVAYQPDLFGAPDQPCESYEPEFFAWTWAGMTIPPTADEVRQIKMLRADTLTAADAARLDGLAALWTRKQGEPDPLGRVFDRAIREGWAVSQRSDHR